MSFENSIVRECSRKNLTKESTKEETMDLLLNVGWENDLNHRNGKYYKELAYLTLIGKTI